MKNSSTAHGIQKSIRVPLLCATGLRRKEEFFSAARVRRHKCLLHPVMVYIHDSR
jgi:hypothetical protein